MLFDWTISLGNILTAISFIVAVAVVISRMRTDIRLILQRLGAVERDLDRIANVIVEIARQEERLGAIDHRLNDFNNRLMKIEVP